MLSKNKITRCIVACLNSNGEPDLFYVKIGRNSIDTDYNLVIDKAIEVAENNGYDCCGRLVFTQCDNAFSAFSRKYSNWKNTSLYII
jgi:hypothetical protein